MQQSFYGCVDGAKARAVLARDEGQAAHRSGCGEGGSTTQKRFEKYDRGVGVWVGIVVELTFIDGFARFLQ
jgi:hypothetical protein